MIALAALAWQVADAISYRPALARNPTGELWFAALTSVDRAEFAKVIGICACAVILAVLHRYRRLYLGGAAVVGIVGAFGAATNLAGWLG